MSFRRLLHIPLALFICLALLCGGVLAAYGDFAPEALPALDCEAVYMVELNTGTVIADKNAEKRLYPASITKVMTALVAVMNAELEEKVVFSRNAIFGLPVEYRTYAYAEGESTTLGQCLYSMLLPSVNEACLAVAEKVAGSVSAFVELMNQTAAQLGCTDTRFTNPYGMHDENHYTTARDIAVIFSKALSYETLYDIMSSASFTLSATNLSPAKTLVNSNRLILPGNQYYDARVKCGKTGFTTPASNTLVTYSESNGLSYITVILKAATGITFSGTTALLDFCDGAFSLNEVESLFSYAVSLPTADGGSLYAQPAQSFYILSHIGDDISAFRKEYTLPSLLEGEIFAGDVLGRLDIYDGDERVGGVVMVARSDYGIAKPVDQTTTPTSTGESSEQTTAGEQKTPKKFKDVLLTILLVAVFVILACVLIYAAVFAVSLSIYRKRNRK